MKSFEIDHTKLTPGIYKHAVSGFVTTWDIRIKTPNSGDYLSPAIIHTIEHTMANYLRGKYGDHKIVGIFPMGCQTGFYVLTRGMNRKTIYKAITDYIDDMSLTIYVPGATEEQCGNYKLQDLTGAKRAMRYYLRKWLILYNSAIDYPE